MSLAIYEFFTDEFSLLQRCTTQVFDMASRHQWESVALQVLKKFSRILMLQKN